MPYIHRDKCDVAYNKIISQARRAQSIAESAAATVLIIVAPDVDALCACRILVSLLNDDCVGYRVVPCSGWNELARINEEQVEANPDLRTIILLNLGALVDLTHYFTLPQQASLHVIDSHRPWNLNNLFASGDDFDKVIVWDDGDIESDLQEERTAFEAVQFEPESDSEDDDSDSDDDQATNIRRRRIVDSDEEELDSDGEPFAGQGRAKRRRLDSEGNEVQDEEEEHQDDGIPRLTKRQKQQYRGRLAKYYRAGTFFGQSIAMQMYVLVTLLERTHNDLLWLAIIGLTQQFTTALIDRERYDAYALVLSNEVARLNIHHDLVTNAGSVTFNGPNDRSIRPSEELRFMLFRHWNLYDSIFHSGYVAGKLKLWRERGRKSLLGLLAKMGFSIAQCQQTYTHMDMDLKLLLRSKIDSIAPEYGLFDLAYPSFVRASGYQTVLSASDSVEAIGALLEVGTAVRLDFGKEEGYKSWGAYLRGQEEETTTKPAAASNTLRGTLQPIENGVDRNRTQPATEESTVKETQDEWWIKNFWLAWNALSPDCSDLRKALHLSMALHRSIIRQGTSLLDKQAIRTLRTFRLAIVREGPDLGVFSHPSTLSRLTVWLIDAVRDLIDKEKQGGARRTKSLPFVVACLDERRDTFLVVGMNGAAEYGDVRKNKFGLAFQEAAQISGARTRHDKFDAGVLEIRKDDLQDFLDKLQLALN